MNAYDEMLALDDVNFTETNPAIIETELISDYQRITNTVLYPADPVRLFLCTLAYRIAQERAIYNDSAKQTLLRYAKGAKLDHIGVIVGAPRISESYAKTIFRFYLSTPLTFNVAIPIGTRGTTKEGSVFFTTDSELIIVAGKVSGEVTATSLVPGEKNNDIQIGEINTIIDPVAYVTKLENISISSGGTDTESDDDYKNRIALAPERFSSAGPELAYKYHALSAHQNVSSVEIEGSENGGIVRVIVLLKNGVIPGKNSAEMVAVEKALNAEKIRPINDTVDVVPAQAISRDYTITWYLPQSLAALQSTTSEKIKDAVNSYEKWQTTVLGRDINPDELIALCKAAGAKRIEINGLSYQKLTQQQVCQFVKNQNRITYGGIERSS